MHPLVLVLVWDVETVHLEPYCCSPCTKLLWGCMPLAWFAVAVALDCLFHPGDDYWGWALVGYVWKLCRPLRISLHFMIAYATANSSNSITAYLDSVGVRKPLPACTINYWFVPGCCCCKTKPNPCRLASVHRRVGLLRLKYANVGTVVRCSFALLNACSFAGFNLSPEGYCVDLSITDAVSSFPAPSSRSDLRSFFGLVNQLSSCTDTIAALLGPLRPLLSTKNDFLWSPEWWLSGRMCICHG